MEGALAIAGPTAVIPVAGWAAAAIVLIGAGILAGGLALHSQAKARIHRPIELWAARSVFGTLENDGERRENITLDQRKRLPAYSSVSEEIKSWYAAYFAPALLDEEQARAFGVLGVDSRWHDDTAWRMPNWGKIATNSVAEEPSVAEFTILLPDYVLGQSDWKYELSESLADQNKVSIAGEPTIYIVEKGLIAHFKNDMQNYSNLVLDVIYKPNEGLDENAEAPANFVLER